MENPQADNLTKLKILHNNVLILPLEFGSGTKVIDPAQYEDKPEWGVVVAFDETRVSGTIKTGDVVCFGQYASTTVRSHGVDFFFVQFDEILAVYRENS